METTCEMQIFVLNHSGGTSNISDILREYQKFLIGFYNGGLLDNIF